MRRALLHCSAMSNLSGGLLMTAAFVIDVARARQN